MKGVFARMLMELASQSAETDMLTNAVYAAEPAAKQRATARRFFLETREIIEYIFLF